MSQPLEIQFEDSLGTIRQPHWTYRVSSDGTEIGVLLEPLRGPQTVHVAASDSSSNADTSSTSVRMLANTDTLRVHVEQFFSLHGRDSTDNVNRFLDDGTFGFVSSGLQPIDSIRNQIMVSSADSSTEFAFSLRSANGRAIFIDPDPGVSFSDTVVVSVESKLLHPDDSVNTATFVRLSDTELGELSGVVQWPDSSSSIIVVLTSESQSLRDVRQAVSDAADGGRFIFERLGVGTYGIDAFVDTNGNEQWDIGSIYPFLPYEPITWIPDTLRVRPRWESVIADTIRFEIGNEISPIK